MQRILHGRRGPSRQKLTTLALEGGTVTEFAACSLKNRNLKQRTHSYCKCFSFRATNTALDIFD